MYVFHGFIVPKVSASDVIYIYKALAECSVSSAPSWYGGSYQVATYNAK